MTITEWMSGQSHKHLHAVNMAGRHGIRLPGLLIVPSETKQSITILWKQPGSEQLATFLDFEQHELPDTVVDVQARNRNVSHNSEPSEHRELEKTATVIQWNPSIQETRNAGGIFTSNAILSKKSLTASKRIHVTARQFESVIWDLTVDGDDIVLQRLCSVGIAPEVSTQRSLCFTADCRYVHEPTLPSLTSTSNHRS
jgi:hypothetical protein